MKIVDDLICFEKKKEEEVNKRKVKTVKQKNEVKKVEAWSGVKTMWQKHKLAASFAGGKILKKRGNLD